MRCPENTLSNKAHWPTIARVLAPLIMVALSEVTAADAYSPPTRVEVFTTTEQAVAGASSIDFKQQVSEIDLSIWRWNSKAWTRNSFHLSLSACKGS